MNTSENTSKSAPIHLLCLHGAGNSDKNRINYLPNLLNQSIKIHSFDFVGFGESGVDISQSSLKLRQKHAESVIKTLGLVEPLNVLGSSMGAYNAVKLLEKYSIANLFLFCPGLYTPAAFEINFGTEFTKIIRKTNSWHDSDAFDLLSKYTGNLFVCIGENDEVIPKDLIQKIMEVSKNTRQQKLCIVPKADHGIHTFLAHNPNEAEIVAKEIESFLGDNSGI